MTQTCKGNHIKDAERFIWDEGPHSCQVKQCEWGKKLRFKSFGFGPSHPFFHSCISLKRKFKVQFLFYRALLSPEEQSHWLCDSWLSPGQWTWQCLGWITHFGPEQSLLILGSQHSASFFSWSLQQKSEGDSVHGKTKAEGKQTFCRREVYDGTDGLPGTHIDLPALVQTSPMTLGE